MGLFSSRFAKLEAYTDLKAGDRKPEHLAEAQTEMDRASAGLILVPTTDTIKTGKDLDAHIDGLKSRAEKAEGDLAEANKTITKLKGTTPETGKPDAPVVAGSPSPGTEETPAQKEQRELDTAVAAQDHNKTADRYQNAV